MVFFSVALLTAPVLKADTFVGGSVGDQTWTVAGSPYIVTNDVAVTANLTIQSGATVLFIGSQQFLVSGQLNANGTSNNPILFQPAPGITDWRGLEFLSGGVGLMTNCVFTGCSKHAIQVDADALINLQGCTMAGNKYSAYDTIGGAAVYSSGNLYLSDCSFTNNALDPSLSGDGYGGAIYTAGTLVAQRCRFLGNYMNTWGGSYAGPGCYGGAIYCASGTVSLEACDFEENYLGLNNFPGGQLKLASSYGGAIFVYTGVLQATGCRFAKNGLVYNGYPEGGTAVYLDGGAGYFTNCLFTANYFFDYFSRVQTGAATVEGGTGAIVNCTIVSNGRPTFGYYSAGVSDFAGEIINSIVYGNYGNRPGQILDSPSNVAYCLVQGGYTNGATTNIITVDPLFADTTYYFLSANSPAIDAGDPDSSFNDVEFPPSQGGARNDLGIYGGPDALSALNLVPSLVFTTQPASQILSFGLTAVFSASASGGFGPLTYQWQFNGTNIIGATNSALTLANVSLQQSGYYRVMAGNFAGMITSDSASLTVTRIRTYVGLTISGVVGGSYQIQYMTNLNNTTWTTLTNIVLPSSPYLFFDADSAESPGRFYRFVLTQ